jgi:hypothetical protein
MREYPGASVRGAPRRCSSTVGVATWGADAPGPRSRHQASIPVSLAINGAGFALFVAALMLTGAMDAEQRRFVLSALRDPRGSIRALRGG